MPESSRLCCVLALLVAWATGCQQSHDGEFHTLGDPAKSVAATTTVTTPDQPPSGVIPASAETVKAPPEVAAIAITGPATPTVTAADPVAPVPKPANTELAVSPSLAPSANEALASLTKPGFPQIPPSELQLLIPEKTFKVEGPEGALRVSFDDIDLLKVLNVHPVPLDIEQHLPAWLSGLNGKRIVLRGWMYPPNQETDIPGFIFVRDNEICCFGRTPMIYDKLGVTLREGQTTHYIQGRPFDVHGIMVVKSRIIDGEWFWLYMINDAVVLAK